MDSFEFKELCLCGETTRVQFKREFTSQKEIAKEISKSLPYVYKKKKQIIEKLKEEFHLSFPFEYKEEVM